MLKTIKEGVKESAIYDVRAINSFTQCNDLKQQNHELAEQKLCSNLAEGKLLLHKDRFVHKLGKLAISRTKLK